MIIAVDFNGTIAEKQYPRGIGAPNIPAIQELIRRRRAGDKVILWTCWSGQELEEMIEFSRQYGLEYDAVNANVPEVEEWIVKGSPKIYADEYWDDRAKSPFTPTCDNCPNRRETKRKKDSIYIWCANTCKNYRHK